MSKNEYIPGVCNIGKEEINRRRKIGIYGLVFTIIASTLFIYLDFPKDLRLLIIIPAFTSTMGILQAQMHFCARFGLTSFFNFDSLGKHNKITDNEFYKMDRLKALKIIFYSFIIGVIFTLMVRFI